MKKYWKRAGALAAFLLVCAAAAAVTKSSETLLDYARKKPEIAYAEPERETDEEELSEKETDKKEMFQAADKDKASGVQKAEEENTEEANTEQEKIPKMSEEDAEMTEDLERVEYQPDFYYEPLSEDLKKRITGSSYKEDCPIPYDDLRYVNVLYVNFKGNTSMGELICNKAIAQDLVEIFYELYQADYQIEQIRLIDEYGADDDLSMQDNNSSCFNYRTIAGTNKISMHGQGLAVDINPFFNPYVTYHDGEVSVAPSGAESYVDRSKEFAYKIDENDLCYRLFSEHGFSWGGNWNSSKDYQHFEKKM